MCRQAVGVSMEDAHGRCPRSHSGESVDALVGGDPKSETPGTFQACC
jgi:hypothetical protein